MLNIATELENLSLESQKLMRMCFESQSKAGSWIIDYVQKAKNILNQNSFTHFDSHIETPKRASKGSLPKPVRVLSEAGGVKIVLTPAPPESPRGKENNFALHLRESNKSSNVLLTPVLALPFSPPPKKSKSVVVLKKIAGKKKKSNKNSRCQDDHELQSAVNDNQPDEEEKIDCQDQDKIDCQDQDKIDCQDQDKIDCQDPDEIDCQDQDEIEIKNDKTFYLSPEKHQVSPEVKNNSIVLESEKSIRSNRSGLKRVLASTKASKHRNSLNRTIMSSCIKPPAKSRVLRPTREKQEHEEALAKKQALLRMKVEEQKRKREMKMERNLRARQQLEQKKQEEQRLKKMSEMHREENIAATKDAEKRKIAAKNKKRKQRDSSIDSEKPSVCPSMKIKKVNPAKPVVPPVVSKTDSNSVVKVDTSSASNVDPNIASKILSNGTSKAVSNALLKIDARSPTKSDADKFATPKRPEENEKLNATYVADNKVNSESYTMTPSIQEMSYSNYEMSELRPSDDDDDEVDPSKPIPSWANGIRLKEALIKQYYNPPDVDELFPPIKIKEDESFGMKRRKVNRTSSAVWLSTPLRNY